MFPETRAGRRRTRRGSLFLEAVLALAVIAVVFGMLAWRQTQTARDARDAAAASALRTVQQAVTTVLARNLQPTLDLFAATCPAGTAPCPAGSAVRLSFDDALPGQASRLLDSGLLPPGFQNRTVHGQTYEIWLKRTGATQLEGLVLTRGGTALADGRASEIATRADPGDGGMIDGGNIVRGAYGTWQVDLASYVASGGMLPAPGRGHVALLLRFDESRAYGDYLNRYPTGAANDEPQRMHANIDMNNRSIDNASDMTVRFSIALAPDAIAIDADCRSTPQGDLTGRIASAAAGEPVICAQGNDGTTRWRRLALLPRCNPGEFLRVQANQNLSCVAYP